MKIHLCTRGGGELFLAMGSFTSNHVFYNLCTLILSKIKKNPEKNESNFINMINLWKELADSLFKTGFNMRLF